MQLNFVKSEGIKTPKGKKDKHVLSLEAKFVDDNDNLIAKVSLKIEGKTKEACEKILKENLDSPVEMTLKNI